MDSHALIELLRLPYKTRLAQQYASFEKERSRGSLVGRESEGPVRARTLYKDLVGDQYRLVLNFGSNNYLGLSHHPYVRERVKEAVDRYGIGTGGSPAFSGYSRAHREVEARLAALAAHEDALLLPSGFMANLCWVNGLMKRQDILLYDKHSHASVLAAIKMAGVRFFPFDPEDMGAFDELAKHVANTKAANAQVFSTIEGVRSIDGAVVDVGAWIRVCRQYDVVTVLDDAHGLGTLGARGSGTLEHLHLLGQVDMRMSTCSKGLGAQGAFLSGSRQSIHNLRTLGNAYVFTTALAYPTVAAISAGLDVLEREPELVTRLHANVTAMRECLERAGHRVGRSPAGIVPVYLRDGVAKEFNRELYAQGLFAHVMEYPMVPPGMERLRISMAATHTAEDIADAVEIIERAAKKLGGVRA
jgi:glycine C-acetyltransferase